MSTITTGPWTCTRRAASACHRARPRTASRSCPESRERPMTITHASAPAIPGLTFRHATPADWDAMAAAQNAARRADGVDEVQTGEGLAGEHPDGEIFQLARDMLIAEIDGTLVGFAAGCRVHRDAALLAETWGVVHPHHRRRGIGTALMRTTRARLVEESAADPRPGPR